MDEVTIYRAKGVCAIVASAFGFAVMAALVRLADDFGPAVSPFQKSFFRNIVAFAVALFVFLRSRRSAVAAGGALPGKAPPRALALLFLRSVLGTCGIFANFYALCLVPIASCQTLNKTAPFFTVLFAWLFLGEKATSRSVKALLVAFAGVVLVAKPAFAGVESAALLVALSGGAFAGCAYASVRALRRLDVDAAFIVLFFSAFSSLAALPFMVFSYDPMTAMQLVTLLGAGAAAALGQFGLTLAYGYAAPRDIAVYDYSNILFTAALGFVLFGQIPDILSVLGFVLVLVAAIVLNSHSSRC